MVRPLSYHLSAGLLTSALVLAIQVGMASGPPAATVSPETVVARVGDSAITAGEVTRLLARAVPDRDVGPPQRAVLEAQVLEEIIARRLVLAYAHRTGSGVASADVDRAQAELEQRLQSTGRSLADYLQAEGIGRDELRRQLEWNLVWDKFLARYLTPEREAGYFRDHHRQLDGTRLAVSQILLRPGPGLSPGPGPAGDAAALLKRAEELRAEISAGKISFADAARKYSQAPSARDGGRLGLISRRGAMEEAFARAAFALAVGEVSPPVRTHFGVSLIRCDGQEPGQKTLAQVRPQVEEALARELLESLGRVQRRNTAVEFTGRIPYFKPGTRELVWPAVK